ncbi:MULTISPECIES: DUF4189 domain-containing protein [Neisseria]|uniref:DUF4189 domain-containing protein n=1 Tax=Neisseria macacae ATCC 33926 TaxID=997348 RepID=A0AA36UL78_9NEIS|nr:MULTISPECIES: DUF4189 domain-containing protein [Neisseria]EGQ77656.1 hypothetical protein HMPREF9418_0781 [Neisseria macacae ATCC 33926]UNV85532.1 DUF4189 domain-containing protein [Neisseria macacae ATCC 33926]
MKKLFFVLLGLTSLNVYAADPTYDATRGALQNNSALCQYGYNPNCASSRQHQRKQPTEIVNINVPSKYGALAVNLKTGISGGALDMDSRAAAEREAIRTCEREGSNKPCVIAASVRNGCIAVAQGNKGKILKTFYGMKEPGLAETEALRKCRAAGVSGCKIVVSEGCSMPKF